MKATLKIACILFAALLLSTCKKTKINEENIPDPYPYSADVERSQQISSALFTLSDLVMICAYAGERQTFNMPYSPIPGQGNRFTAIIDTLAKQLVFSWNDALCNDGHTRSGSVFMFYKKDPNSNPNANDNAKYFRDFGFVGRIMLSNYKVDGNLVENMDQTAASHIFNTSAAQINPVTEKLNWRLDLGISIKHSSDPSKDVICKGALKLFLDNTNEPVVFNPNKMNPINWNLSKVSFSGTLRGSIGTEAFALSVDDVSSRVARDFNCSTPLPAPIFTSLLHPFISGKAGFFYGNFHPRTIDFGPGTDCDTKGTVSFADESHPVEFRF